jgi:phage terminase large subunit-like protein
MAASPSSALLGRTEPRIFTPPLRELTPQTSRGYEAITFAEDVVGITLHPWQKWLLIHALELLPDSSYRFRTVLVLVARQNGKTTLVQVLALWRMFVDQAPLVIGTAQSLDVAEEAWQGAVDIAQGVPELADEIQHVDRTNGKKQLRLHTGERYKVAAASRRGGRGLSGDLIVLDELREHQNWQAWGAVSKTTMARSAAQIWGLSNAGDRESVVLDALRRRALDALSSPGRYDDHSLGIFEWSAPPRCEITDPDGWAQANPSLGHPNGVSVAAVRAALSTDPEPVVRTEVLCQWVDRIDDAVIEPAAWLALGVGVQPMSYPAFAIEVALDRSSATIGAAWHHGDKIHVEVVEDGAGVAWVPARIAQLVERYSGKAVVLDASTEAAGLGDELENAGLPVLRINGAARVAACGAFYDAATNGGLSHNGDPALDVALANARWKQVGDGARVFSRRRSAGDISALYAVVLAQYGLGQSTVADFYVL